MLLNVHLALAHTHTQACTHPSHPLPKCSPPPGRYRIKGWPHRRGGGGERREESQLSTYKTIHLAPHDLLALQTAAPARQEALTASQQRPPLRRQRAEDGSGVRDLGGRAAEQDALPHARAEVGKPSPWGRLWRQSGVVVADDDDAAPGFVGGGGGDGVGTAGAGEVRCGRGPASAWVDRRRR